MTDPNCDACESSVTAPPPIIHNRPGLSAIRYRIRAYASFRRAMLTRIPFERVEGKTPLADWTTRLDDDFGIALIDLWAYVADVLTFYQERTANEAYLRTARRRDSLRRLSALIDYLPAPGMAAAAYLAFMLQAPTPSNPETVIKPGVRVQSVPGQDEKPQKFETIETRTVRHAWNLLKPVTMRPQTLTRGTTAIYLTGAIRSIKVGDALLIVGDERIAEPGSERWDFRLITRIDYLNDLTKVTLNQPLGAVRVNVSPAGQNPCVYVMRKRASLFGYNAPDWGLLPEIAKRQALGHAFDIQTTLTESGTTTKTITTTTSLVAKAGQTLPALPADWNFAANPAASQTIDLDALYPTILSGDWIVLERPSYYELYRVQDASAQARSDFLISGKVTRLALDTDENLPSFKAQTRSVVVHYGQEALPFGAFPIADPFPTTWIDVEGDQSGLERERPILLVGVANGAPASERAFLNAAAYDAASDTTRLTFLDPLQHSYERETLAIYANVVEATHGETVRETLGSGDASQPFQAFVLQKQPVTYIPEAGAPNGAGSTLEIRVNDVKWDEARSFYGQDGARAVYTTRTDDDGAVTVRFGDGVTGQRLPTGRGNVTAVYRYGIGSAGNLRAGTLKTLLDRPLGVKSVINPLPSEGGAERERAEDIRANAPNTVRTFGRIVSLRDFEDAAREYAGVAKARAAIEWDGEDQQVRLTVAGDNGADILPGGSTYSALLEDLNRRRDPNRRLILSNYRRFGVILTAKLIIDTPAYLPERVIDDVRSAVTAYFAFDQQDLGRSVYLSDLYRVIHDVKGVEAVDVEEFRPTVPPPPPPRRPPPRRPPPRRPLIYEAIDVDSDQLIALDALTLTEMQEPTR